MANVLKKKPRIQFEFFKGIIGAMLSIVIWEISGLFRVLAELVESSDAYAIFGNLETLALLGVFFFPVWYWIFYPMIAYSREESMLTTGSEQASQSSSSIPVSKARIKHPDETRTSLYLILTGLTGAFSFIIVILSILLWILDMNQDFLIFVLITGIFIIISIISFYFTKINYDKYQSYIKK